MLPSKRSMSSYPRRSLATQTSQKKGKAQHTNNINYMHSINYNCFLFFILKLQLMCKDSRSYTSRQNIKMNPHPTYIAKHAQTHQFVPENSLYYKTKQQRTEAPRRCWFTFASSLTANNRRVHIAYYTPIPVRPTKIARVIIWKTNYSSYTHPHY